MVPSDLANLLVPAGAARLGCNWGGGGLHLAGALGDKSQTAGLDERLLWSGGLALLISATISQEWSPISRGSDTGQDWSCKSGRRWLESPLSL